MKKHIFSLLTIIVCTFALFAQDPRGTIVGKVTDSSGAVIPGATVRAANTATNVTLSSTSNGQGQYEIPYLLPGVYTVQAESSGFKKWTRGEIELRTGDRVRVDIQLEVGNLTQTVKVTTTAPVLETTTGSIAQVMTSEEATALPERGGSLAWIYALAPGIILPGLPGGGPWNISQGSNFSVAGSGSRGFDFNVDGVSSNSYGGRTAFTPAADMVQEVRVQTASYDASIGHTRGGSLSISLKSGTNKLHGRLGFSTSRGSMVTRNFFTDQWIFDPETGPITDEKIKSHTPPDTWDRYTVSVGGPVVIPKLYNGRNKTFWMFGYQDHERHQSVAHLVTVPTEAERAGDFSALLAIGSDYQIYDPFTTKPKGSRLKRQPLPGNIIPASFIDPIGQKIMNYYPMPNTPGTADGLSDYSISTPKDQIMKQPVARIDHNFSESHRMFARYSQTNFNGHFDQYVPDSTVRGRSRKRPHRGMAFDNVFVLSPETVLDVRYGFTWFSEVQAFDNQGWDLTEFGFPSSLLSELNPEGISFPTISTDHYMTLGNDGGYTRTYYTHSLSNVFTWIKGNHSLKFGSDLRLYFENNKTFGDVSPQLNFSTAYTRGPLDNSPTAPVGQDLASMLFGLPTGGHVNLNDSRAEVTHFYGFYVQDDWRVTKKLTLNLGLRWEYESPITERFNRGARDFDFKTPNPIQDEAQANYAKSPIPQVPVSEFQTLGGITFLGVGGNPRNLRDPYYGAWMPRIGLAYHVTPRTVIRMGYGIFFGMLGSEFHQVSQPGFSKSTSVVASVDNGISYIGSISNPLPFGLQYPLGPEGGLQTNLGAGPGFDSADGRRPYTQRWSATVQFKPFSRTVLEVGYIGSKNIRQRVGTAFNAVPREYLSTSRVRDQAAIDFLSAKVVNPFRGIAGFAGSKLATAKKTSRAQLMRPFPEFTGLSTSLPAGSGWYNALTVRFERRLTSGLQFRAAYTWSKTIRATSYLNDTDSLPEHVVASLDRPHRIVISAIYHLPFGSGKPIFGNAQGLWNRIVSGWQTQGIYQGQSGAPLNWGNVIYTGDFTGIKLPSSERSLQQWFNPAGFERGSKLQLSNNIRTFPSRISGVRDDGINVLDFSLFKNITVREGMTVQIRGEAENLMNHPNFDPPNRTPKSSNFGRVTGTQGDEGARRVFVGVKFIF